VERTAKGAAQFLQPRAKTLVLLECLERHPKVLVLFEGHPKTLVLEYHPEILAPLECTLPLTTRKRAQKICPPVRMLQRKTARQKREVQNQVELLSGTTANSTNEAFNCHTLVCPERQNSTYEGVSLRNLIAEHMLSGRSRSYIRRNSLSVIQYGILCAFENSQRK